MLPVALLAGGLASRIWPVTHQTPKALVAVAGEPFAFHQLRLLARRGIRRVVYLVGHLGDQIVDTVGDGAGFGVSVEYVFDGPALRGTGGAIAEACPVLGKEFFVLYGDSYLDCDYAAVEAAFRCSGLPALMTVFPNAGRWEASNVEFERDRIVSYDKRHPTARMRHVDYGLGVFQANVFRERPSAAGWDLADVYHDLAAANRLAALEVSERFYEVGSFAGIEDLARHLTEQRRQ